MNWILKNKVVLSQKKNNEIMTFAATWMDLEMTILGEVSQTEKDKYHMISLICRILKKKLQGGRFKREGTYIDISMADSCWYMPETKNIVWQLPSN